MNYLSPSLLLIILWSSIGVSQTPENQNAGKNPSSLVLTPVIYVPGIMGSPLYDDINNNNRLTVDEKAWLGIQLPSMWLAGNGVDPAGNFNVKVAPIRNDSDNTLRNELHDVPMDLFLGFFDNLEANGYILDDYDDIHTEGENLFCFTYDWRKDNTYNAGLLSNFIDSVRQWTGASRVNLVGHSMGGIVSKQCIHLFDKSRIDRMVFIGTPHLGAPEMLTVMLRGKLFEWINFFIADYVVRSLARNLPSCYQLIPSRSYLDPGFNNGISTNVEVYSECFRLPDGHYADYSELIDYLKGYSSSVGEDLNVALINSSELFKEDIDSVDFGGLEVFNIVGYNNLTIGKNSIVIGPPPLNWITVEEERNLNGDFTVPVRSAELINNQVVEHTYYIPNTIHSGLPSCPEALEILLGVFGDPPITYFPKFADPPSSYKYVITTAKNSPEIPRSFYLSQNFPNPFNPTTHIRYELPVSGNVTLAVYDVLGNEVATLVDEERSAGTYEITFYAGNLSSGAYFYRLKTGRSIETRKMLLLK
jgi:pimeloyl-ACP methyl ester carboxylesterase